MAGLLCLASSLWLQSAAFVVASRRLPTALVEDRDASATLGRRQLLAGGSSALILGSQLVASPSAFAEETLPLNLATLAAAWQKLAEGKNPLEAFSPGTRRRLRSISRDLDKLQEDVFSEDYDSVLEYKPVLQKYVPLFTEYTDSVFPGDSAAGRASRVAMRYEVGKFYGAIDRLDKAARQKSLEPMQKAFADMSLAFDRYVKAGDLYAGIDPIVSTELFYQGISDNSLKYLSPLTFPPQIKDPILLIAGPDKGRTGVMIGKEFATDGSRERPVNAFIKFDGGIGEGVDKLQEIKLVPYGYVAKQNAG